MQHAHHNTGVEIPGFPGELLGPEVEAKLHEHGAPFTSNPAFRSVPEPTKKKAKRERPTVWRIRQLENELLLANKRIKAMSEAVNAATSLAEYKFPYTATIEEMQREVAFWKGLAEERAITNLNETIRIIKRAVEEIKLDN